MKTPFVRSVCALLLAVGVSACQSTTGKTAGQTVSDASISTAVQTKLTTDRASNFARVDVDTEQRVVNLSGVVQSADQKARAEQLAREVNGVVLVNNNNNLRTSRRRPES